MSNYNQNNYNQDAYEEESQSQRTFESNEIFTLANQSCLIGFNNLMKNVNLANDVEERKSLSKKNKIQVAYVDLKSKLPNSTKHPKHDFFIDPEEMKYFVDSVYACLLDKELKTSVREHGHKFMGGTKNPCISNIITFKFLTSQEMMDSPANKKILERYNNDKQRYDNAMLDWKNLQVAKLSFEKQEGRIMNGLIVPTGKHIQGANFKPFFINLKDLLEFCVTMRDYIKQVEMKFTMDVKLQELEMKMKENNNHLLAEIRSFKSLLLNNYAKNDSCNTATSPQVNQQGNVTQSQNMPQYEQNQETKEQKILNEAIGLFKASNDLFLNSFNNSNINAFFEFLKVEKAEYNNDTLNLTIAFESSIYKIEDYVKPKEEFNKHYKRCLEKTAKDLGKQYKINVNTL